MACKHRVVTPNALRGIRPSHWPTSDGKMHVEGHCEDCSKGVWRHVLPDEEVLWQLEKVACGCKSAS